MPLVLQSFNWAHGVYLAATMGSETTAAATGQVGVVRRDPMAMLPFCGYNYAHYFAHWLSMKERTDEANLPKIFFVNWFRRDEDGRFLWPGFGENSRVLKWVFERVDGDGDVVDTPIGLLPTKDALDTEGLSIAEADLDEILRVDTAGWQSAIPQIRDYFAQYGDLMPTELNAAVEERSEEEDWIIERVSFDATYGDERVTARNLEVVRVDGERGLLYVRGSVPGHRNGIVRVGPAVKP